MLSTGEIIFLVLDVLFAAAGWLVFVIYQDDWKSVRNTPDERRGWLIATIGLCVGIFCSVALVVFALIVGALAAKKHAKDRLVQLQVSSRQIPPLPR